MPPKLACFISIEQYVMGLWNIRGHSRLQDSELIMQSIGCLLRYSAHMLLLVGVMIMVHVCIEHGA